MRLAPAALLFLAVVAAHAAEDDPSDEPSASPKGPPFKATAGHYTLGGGGLPVDHGLDLNLRHTSKIGNAWIGYYEQRGAGFRQTRGGWDHQFSSGPYRVTPSVQAASGGFRGGSLSAEAGETWFAGAGFGRTNLKPYINLNFDPNDFISLTAGRRWGEEEAVALLLIADNRQNPDQRHLHLSWRKGSEGGRRVTLDLLAKRGDVAGSTIHRLGFTATYDWPRVFVRLAWDPKVNFTPQNMVRVSGGWRF